MHKKVINFFQSINDTEDITSYLQNLINKSNKYQGMKILFDCPGTYIISGITLKSNIELYLCEGVCLKGNGDESSYRHRPGPFELNCNETPICGLFYAKGCENIAIKGQGSIDGNYKEFILPNQENEKHLKFYKYPRPMTLYFEDCKNINLQDIEIKNAPFWTVHLVGCLNTRISEIKIHNEMNMPNTDGIDVDRSKNTLIENCEIITGDDGICPKCTEETALYGNCENLNVKNCYIESQSSAIKFGSSSFGNFENCKFENLNIKGTNRGLAFQLRDPGSAINIKFKNIKIETRRFTEKWWGSGEPIFITMLPRNNETDLSKQKIENIKFENIEFISDNSIFIYSEQKEMLNNIIFENIKATFRTDKLQKKDFDLRPWKGKDIVQYDFKEIVGNSKCYKKINFTSKYVD